MLYICIHGTGNLAMEAVSGERNRERELYDDPPADQQQLVKRVPNHLRPLGADPLANMAPASDSKDYTAAQLAAVIEKEGLSKAHQQIELFACGAGMNDNAEQRAFEQQRVADQVREKFRHDVAAAAGLRQDAMLRLVGERLDEVAAIVRARHDRMDEAAALKRSFGERFFDALRGRGYVGVTVNAYRGDVKAGLVADVPGLAAAPFAVVSRDTTNNPNAPGMRVTYPLPLV
ncbi:hypothetical protein [Gemmatimonas groenlandica]|uniref:Uncharacterized protein n=1 Tax=Gemmatimonas groenlandica TaxID=2732249 RepID=A0A6M4ILC5_9BACT|nr:hypothetical protein [Gemmatimonas groenlandica]QJR34678.1 hypothetical protein HKW67_03700 [Gemmatimonas groenlandica]